MATDVIQIPKKNALNALKNATGATKKALTDLFEGQVYENIMDRVKTIDDAYEVMGLNPKDVRPYDNPKNSFQEGLNATADVWVLAEALNEGWEPDWKNSSEYKYYPWFDMSSGVGLSFVDFAGWDTTTTVGPRLCYKSFELAKYAGTQFIGTYSKMFIK